MIPFLVLDLSPVPVGKTATDAFRQTLDLATSRETWWNIGSISRCEWIPVSEPDAVIKRVAGSPLRISAADAVANHG
ncbi:hypothetical protein C9I57_00285 [Trinickia symbiotica]|uniref:Uncharacterized protein n=1 Tax=Trinickia symbiotica TaxID=863227 RepID=A0A2T3Y0M1_9BURK|nr:hypothetical protein [Trinickia symbiotica]PTB22288.1 hypothetical protein C9I57_00285 [Trinickia symbiotica]